MSAASPALPGTVCVCAELGHVLEPIVRLRDGAVVGHEVLTRPRVGPHDGRWLRTALADSHLCVLRSLLALLVERSLPPGLIFANVTAAELEDGTLAAHLLTRGRPHLLRRLVIEVTEACPIRDAPRLTASVARLRGAGVRFALDDFGEGWSNLDTIATLAPEVIKVSRTVAGETLGEWVVELARRVHALAIVERIESHDDRAWARSTGFAFAQGYLWPHVRLDGPDHSSRSGDPGLPGNVAG